MKLPKFIRIKDSGAIVRIDDNPMDWKDLLKHSREVYYIYLDFASPLTRTEAIASQLRLNYSICEAGLGEGEEKVDTSKILTLLEWMEVRKSQRGLECP